MAELKIKWINAVVFNFIEGERSRARVGYLLRYVFELESRDIIGVGNEGQVSIHVKFKYEDVYNNICSSHHG